jgi:hypothetical protein
MALGFLEGCRIATNRSGDSKSPSTSCNERQRVETSRKKQNSAALGCMSRRTLSTCGWLATAAETSDLQAVLMGRAGLEPATSGLKVRVNKLKRAAQN